MRDSFSFRDFNSVCPVSLNRMLSYCDWEAMNSIESDLEGALNNLNTNLNIVTAELAPLKTISPKKKKICSLVWARVEATYR